MKQTILTLTKKDFEIEYYRGKGNGGQHRNKTDSCCRISHLESGATAHGTEHREQHRNKELAFKRLCESNKFKIWLKKKVSGYFEMEKEVKNWVDDQMQEKNLKIECL